MFGRRFGRQLFKESHHDGDGESSQSDHGIGQANILTKIFNNKIRD